MTEKQRIKRVAALHDLSCFGRCSLSVIIPSLSAMGVQVLPVPTALLSTHTGGFDGYYFQDLTESVTKIADHWEKLGVMPDAIYTGFLANDAQCEVIESFVERFKRDGTVVLVDPVFADDGALYSSCTAALAEKMKILCRHADIIVPNLTEACMLCGAEYADTASMNPKMLKSYIEEILYKLSALGAKRIAVTGIVVDGSNNVVTAGLDLSDESLDRSPFFVSLRRIGGAYPGTGDLFASVLLGKILGGACFTAAVAAASAFVRDVIDYSAKFDTPHREGIALEPCLGKLSEL